MLADVVVVVADGVSDVAGVSVDGEHPAHHRDCAENRSGCSDSQGCSYRETWSGPACSVLVASGSMSFSVRNMKKNTTQPIAAMKIQLISR